MPDSSGRTCSARWCHLLRSHPVVSFPMRRCEVRSMGQRITQVDAFTDRRFGGNPAAVCILSQPAEDSWMQDVAAEMNLSETAFVRRGEGEPAFGLRWFTPN